MKKTILKLPLVICLITASCYLYLQKDNDLNNLVIKNIEALANNENGQSDKNYSCFGTGEIDCYGDKVDTKYEGYSLD